MLDRVIVWFWHIAFILAIIAGIDNANGSSECLLHAGITALIGFWLGRVTA
jgi:hypothetical protein